MIKWTTIIEKDQIFYFDFSNKTDVSKIAPLDAAIKTVHYIQKNYPPPYTLYLSGGIDSQAMLWSWHLSGVKFKTFSAVYNQNLNDHDLENLKIFAFKHQIDLNFVDFDLLSFLEKEHHLYAKSYLCGSPHITTHMKISSLTTEGTSIFSGNFITPALSMVTPNQAALYRYALIENKPLVPWFFLETEEVAHSFRYRYKNPILGSFVSTYDLKIHLYQSNGFPIIPQSTKYTGFEKVKDYIDLNPPRQPSLEDIAFKAPRQNSKRMFDLLYRNKYEARYSKYYYIKDTFSHVRET